MLIEKVRKGKKKLLKIQKNFLFYILSKKLRLNIHLKVKRNNEGKGKFLKFQMKVFLKKKSLNINKLLKGKKLILLNKSITLFHQVS